MKTKYIFVVLTFCATIAQGLWSDWIQNEILMVVDIPLVGVYIFGRSKLSMPPYIKFVMFLVVAFFLWCNIGAFFAVNQMLFRQEAIANIRTFLLFFAFTLFINNKEDLQFIFLGLAFGALFQGMVAIHQWLRGPVGLRFLGELQYGWQARGTFVHASIFGMYISLLSIINYRIAVFLKPRFHKIFLAAFIVGIIGLFASYNRGTWIAFAISMLIMFLVDFYRGNFVSKRTLKVFIIVIFLAAAGGIRYGVKIVNRFADAEESLLSDRSSSRKNLALDAIRIIKAHPLWGVGLNNYREYIDPMTAGTKVVHCSYLLIAAETGIPGGMLFALIVGSIAFVSIRCMRSKDRDLKHIAAALLTATLSFAIAVLPSPDYRILFIKMQIWIMWGLVIATAKLDYHIKKAINKQLLIQKIKNQLQARHIAYPESSYIPQRYPLAGRNI